MYTYTLLTLHIQKYMIMYAILHVNLRRTVVPDDIIVEHHIQPNDASPVYPASLETSFIWANNYFSWFHVTQCSIFLSMTSI